MNRQLLKPFFVLALLSMCLAAIGGIANALPMGLVPPRFGGLFPPPTFTSALPMDCNAGGGTTVQVIGSHLNVGAPTVKIGSLAAVPLSVLSSTTGTFACPAYSTSAGTSIPQAVSITTPGGVATLSGSFGGGGIVYFASTIPAMAHVFGGRWTVSGGNVSSWTNLVAGENNPANSATTQQCLALSAFINGLGATYCNFALASDTLTTFYQSFFWQFANPLPANSPISVYMAAEITENATVASGGRGILWAIGTEDGANNYLFLEGPLNDAAAHWGVSTPSGGITSSLLSDFDAHALAAVSTGDGGASASNIKVDTTATTGTIAVTGTYNGYNCIGAGCAQSAGAAFDPTSVIVYEVLVFKGADSNTDRDEKLAELTTTWSL